MFSVTLKYTKFMYSIYEISNNNNNNNSMHEDSAKMKSLFTCLSSLVCALAQIYLILFPLLNVKYIYQFAKIIIQHMIFFFSAFVQRSKNRKYSKRVASAENI